MEDLKRFFRANPQVLVLVLVCLILGLGTFFIVLFGLATSGQHSQISGEPSGVLALGRALF